MRWMGFALAGVVAAAACGDDDGGDACAAAGRALCDRACACTEGDACAITDETGGVTLSFDTPDECVGLFVGLGCSGGGDATTDFEACEAAVGASSMCIEAGTDEMGNPRQAYVSPPACDSMM